ncbi:MAG: hypothetical protein ACPGJV_07945 [Bacteriovoracaceae bacterium]
MKRLLTLTFILMSFSSHGINFNSKLKPSVGTKQIDRGQTPKGTGLRSKASKLDSTQMACAPEKDGYVSYNFFLNLMNESKEVSYNKETGILSLPSYISGDGCFEAIAGAQVTDAIRISDSENVKYNFVTLKNGKDLSWEHISKELKAPLKKDDGSELDPKVLSKNQKRQKDISWFKNVKIGSLEYDEAEPGEFGRQWDRLSEEHKIMACLEAKGKIVEDSSGDYVLGNDIKPADIEDVNTFTLSTDNGGDEMTTIKLAMASPANAKFPRAYGPALEGSLFSLEDDGKSCFKLEKLNEGEDPVVFENAMIAEAMNLCQIGDVYQMDKKLHSLYENYSSLSGSNAYKISLMLLEDARDKSRDEKEEDILAELKEIGSEIKKLRKGGKWDADDDDAEDFMSDYIATLKKFNEQVVDSYIRELNYSLNSLKHLRGDAKKDELKKIDKLREKIGHLNDKKSSYHYSYVEELAKEFGLMGQAQDVHGFFLKSKYMAQVTKDAKGKDHRSGFRKGFKSSKMKRFGKGLTFAKADDYIEKAYERYESKMEKWEDDYAAKEGEEYPARIALNEVRSINRSMSLASKRHNEREESYAKNCDRGFFGGQVNPVRCKFYNNPQRKRARFDRYNRMMSSHRRALDRATASYQDRRQWAEDARRALAEEEGEYDDYMSYYFHEDDFGFMDDNYYYDDSSLYSMGARDMGRPSSNPRAGNPFQNGYAAQGHSQHPMMYNPQLPNQMLMDPRYQHMYQDPMMYNNRGMYNPGGNGFYIN